jgi:hypothetical protein
VYLMRGLPACGKSHRAKRLAGFQGIVLETNLIFTLKFGTDMARYDCDITPLPAARDWIFRRLTDAIMAEISPTILDRGNGLNSETRQFAVYAIKHGYDVELAEPDSAWWQELRAGSQPNFDESGYYST